MLEVFDVLKDHHLDFWLNSPVDVYLVIRQTDEATGGQTIRWMNVTRYLKARKDKKSRQSVFQKGRSSTWKLYGRCGTSSSERRRPGRGKDHCRSSGTF